MEEGNNQYLNVCFICGSNKTRVIRERYAWYKTDDKKNIICDKCYSRLLYNKKHTNNVDKCEKCGYNSKSVTKYGRRMWAKMENEYWCWSCYSRHINENKRINEETRKKMSNAKKGKRKSFSARLKMVKPKGEKSSNWKGGGRSINLAVRSMSEYKEWRFKVFKKDNFKCTKCNNSNKYVTVNHLIPFSWILRLYNIRSVDDALRCNILWNIDNGETVCENCHIKITILQRKGKLI